MEKQIVEIFGDVIIPKVEAKVLPKIQAVNPDIQTIHYEHGHYVEISNTLSQWDKARALYGKKYPLIAVFEDIPVSYLASGNNETRLQIVICYSTESEYKSQDRYKSVINPILEPVYKELIKQITRSGYFNEYRVRHDKIIRPYYGVDGKYKNEANIFNDFLDAIELKNVRLKLYNQPDCTI